MKMWARMKPELAEVHIHGLLVLLICMLDVGSQGQTVCRREATTQWLMEPQTLEVRWTLAKKTCSTPEECWGMQGRGREEDLSGTLWTFPQMCPVQLQFGDKLLISADDALESYGIHLLNVSEETFRSCSTAGYPPDQLLFPGYVKGTVEVDPKWLRPGTHCFSAIREGDPELCEAGLRLVVRVKGHRCHPNASGRLCSGNGACRAAAQDDMFSCACHRGFSGRFCERFDGRPNRCHMAGSVCVRRGLAYEFVCPSQPAGVSCSDVVRLCNERCLNGRCQSVTPNSIRCMCDLGFTDESCHGRVCRSPAPRLGFSPDGMPVRHWAGIQKLGETFYGLVRCNQGNEACQTGPDDGKPGVLSEGPFCERKVFSCDSSPCKNSGTCVEKATGRCAEGFLGPDCGSELAGERLTHDHPHEWECNSASNTSACAKKPDPCGTNPCLSHGSHMPSGEQYLCRCLQGFTGRDCEEVTDYCSMLGIGCQNEGLCLSVNGGYRCLCAPGWTGEFCQHVQDACHIHPDRCQNGAACVDGSQQGTPPNYTCLCLHGYTGFHCKTDVNECGSNPCLHGGMCRDLIGSYECMCPPEFLGENCEVNADAYVPPNATCLPESGCTFYLDGRPSNSLTSCPQHVQPCANGGRCFLTGDDGAYSCHCAAGWTGQDCQQNIDECVAHWCQHGATCVDGIGTFRCLCRHGYTGAFCEQRVTYCVRCGACVNQGSGYTCRCMLGNDGGLCEMEVDECGSWPCANGAVSTGSLTGATCHCPPGFKGRTCSDKAIGRCSSPCLDGGICVDLINGYTCRCPVGSPN